MAVNLLEKNKYKSGIKKILYVFFIILIINKSGFAEMTIVSDKNPKATIIIPEKPTYREQFAANELQKYLYKITGASLAIKNAADKEEGNLILIGGPGRNSKTKYYIDIKTFDNQVPGPEGLMIQTVENKVLVLAGSTKTPNEKE